MQFKNRLPKNKAEGLFCKTFEKANWSITKRGWPDFFCWRGKELMLVEVKPRACSKLKPAQLRIMEALSRAGIACYLWTPKTGLEPYTTTLPP